MAMKSVGWGEGMDGDKVHADLDQRWQDSYKQLCEWGFGREEIAENIAERLKKDVRMYGDGPIKLLRRFAELLDPFADEPLLCRTDAHLRAKLEAEEIARCASGRPRAIEAAQLAFEQQLQDIKWGIFAGGAQEVMAVLAKKYIENIYVSNFEEHVPFNPTYHYNGVDQITVSARLKDVRPIVNREIASLARQLCRETSRVTHLRMAAHKRNRNIDENYRVPLPA